MTLKLLEQAFTVCKVTSLAGVDFTQPYVFVAKTDDELSLVCESRAVPQNTTEVEAGFRGLKICGVLDFSLIGIIAKISAILAEHRISVFVVSTFNTDYILVKEESLATAISELDKAGYVLLLPEGA